MSPSCGGRVLSGCSRPGAESQTERRGRRERESKGRGQWGRGRGPVPDGPRPTDVLVAGRAQAAPGTVPSPGLSALPLTQGQRIGAGGDEWEAAGGGAVRGAGRSGGGRLAETPAVGLREGRGSIWRGVRFLLGAAGAGSPQRGWVPSSQTVSCVSTTIAPKGARSMTTREPNHHPPPGARITPRTQPRPVSTPVKLLRTRLLGLPPSLRRVPVSVQLAEWAVRPGPGPDSCALYPPGLPP